MCINTQAQEYNYGLRSSMLSHAHVVSRLSVHVLLIFATKSVRARMIHIYVCSVQCVHVLSVRTYVRARLRHRLSLSLGTVYSTEREKREQAETCTCGQRYVTFDTSRSTRHVRHVTFARSAEQITVT